MVIMLFNKICIMFDYRELKNNLLDRDEGFRIFDKKAYENFIETKNIDKNKFFEFYPKGEIHFGTGIIELLDTHRFSGQVFAINNEINLLVISTTNIHYPIKIPPNRIMPFQLDQLRRLGFFKSEMVYGDKTTYGTHTIKQVDTVSDNIDINKFIEFTDSTKNHKYDPPVLIPEDYALQNNLENRFVDKKFLEKYGVKKFIEYLLGGEEPIYSSLNPELLDKILNQDKFKLFKNTVGKIFVESNEIIICRDYETFLTIKGENGYYDIFELFDESYNSNIEDERSIMSEEKENAKLYGTDQYNENYWIHRKDFGASDPNIHLLLLKKN